MPKIQGKTVCNVVDTILDWIENGECPLGKNIGTEQALAAMFQVSRTTIRRATRYLMEEKRLLRVHGGGFEACPSEGTAAKKNKSRTKLLLIRAADNPLNNEVFEGVMNSPLAANYDIIVLDGAGKYGNYAEILNTLPDDVRNVLLFPLDIPEVKNAITAALKRGVHIVQLDRFLDDVEAPSVMFDNYLGVSVAVRHLLKETSLPVYYFGYTLSPTSAVKRYEAWHNTMLEFGYENSDDYLVCRVAREESDFYSSNYKIMLDDFFARHPEEIAIFAVCDTLAKLVYSCGEAAGHTIGKDLFVVGFDNLALCERLVPQLSSVYVNRKLLGTEALKILHEGTKISSWRQLLPVEMIIRESSRRQG